MRETDWKLLKCGHDANLKEYILEGSQDKRICGILDNEERKKLLRILLERKNGGLDTYEEESLLESFKKSDWMTKAACHVGR